MHTQIYTRIYDAYTYAINMIHVHVHISIHKYKTIYYTNTYVISICVAHKEFNKYL